jgi:hypothetical protein
MLDVLIKQSIRVTDCAGIEKIELRIDSYHGRRRESLNSLFALRKRQITDYPYF